MRFDPSQLDDEPSLADTIRELSNQPSSATWVGRRRGQLLSQAERLTTQGPVAPLAELGWGTSRRLTRVGGSALAALIAYRLFVWLLPLSLVVVSVIALFDDAKVLDPQAATDRFGIAGYVAASVSTATAETGGPGFVSGIVFGGLFLLYATFALVRALRAVHALVWRVRLTSIPSPLRSTLLALGLLSSVVVVGGLIDGLKGSGGILFDLVLIGIGALVLPAAWLLVSLWLPHRSARWVDLLPGAIALGILVDVIHFLVVFVLFPYLQQKAATYGALGLAAGIMLALYGVGYIIAGTAALNAELADRREERAAMPSQ